VIDREGKKEIRKTTMSISASVSAAAAATATAP